MTKNNRKNNSSNMSNLWFVQLWAVSQLHF